MARNYSSTYFWHSVIVIIVLSAIDEHVAKDICLNQNDKNPCLCQLTESTALDISQISKSQLSADFGNQTISYFPCRNTNHKFDHCSNTSLCLIDKRTNITTATNLGSAEEGAFTYDSVYKIIFNNKDKIKTTINLVCALELTTAQLLVKSIAPNSNEIYVLSSKACEIHHAPPPKSMSTGSVLLLLFSIGFGIYFIGGAAILYLLRGARGMEMIPNIDFWRELPLLVRDGFLFLLNGCSLPTTVTTTAETYDRI